MCAHAPTSSFDGRFALHIEQSQHEGLVNGEICPRNTRADLQAHKLAGYIVLVSFWKTSSFCVRSRPQTAAIEFIQFFACSFWSTASFDVSWRNVGWTSDRDKNVRRVSLNDMPDRYRGTFSRGVAWQPCPPQSSSRCHLSDSSRPHATPDTTLGHPQPDYSVHDMGTHTLFGFATIGLSTTVRSSVRKHSCGQPCGENMELTDYCSQSDHDVESLGAALGTFRRFSN